MDYWLPPYSLPPIVGPFSLASCPFIRCNCCRYVLGVFQLNSLELSGRGKANLFWHLPEPVALFQSCAYEESCGTQLDLYTFFEKLIS